MKPIDEGLPQTVVVWLRLWRAVVLEPLRTADPPWTLERMSAELTRRAGGDQERLEGGARGDMSGRAKPTLQRFFAGERVPARDVVQHLLDIACEVLDPPPAREQISELWAAYRTALRTTFGLLADLYDTLDERDAARSRAEHLERERVHLAGQLELSQGREQRAQMLLTLTEAELQRAQQAAAIREEEARRAKAEAADLTRRLRELRAEHGQFQQDKERLEQEAALLREQEEATGVRSQRAAELQSVLETMRQENEELFDMIRTITRALHDAQERARTDPSSAGMAVVQREQPATHGITELRQRHELAMGAVQDLGERLRTVSRDLAEARAELIRRDGDLARLVEEHAEEITSLRAGHVLAEADSVLSLALQRLDPAPAALPPAGDVPAAETTEPPSSAGSAAVSGPAVPDGPRTKPGGPSAQESGPAGDGTEGGTAAGGPSRHARPGTDTADARTAPAGATAATSRTRLLRKRAGIAAAGLILVAALGLGIGWAMNRSGGDGAEPENNSKSRSASASASATASGSVGASGSPLPSKPAEDPVADIGDQEVNTAAVMKLPPCAKGDATATVSPGENSFSGLLADIRLEIKAAEAGRVPCRVDVARDRIAITITSASSDDPSWDSAACFEGYDGHRWLRVSRSRPAAVAFTWDRVPNNDSCQQNTFAPSGTYLVETTVLGKKARASFVMSGGGGGANGSGGTDDNFFGGPAG